MPRGNLTKDEMKCIILKQKLKLDLEPYYTSDPKLVANNHLDELLDRLEEFRY